MRPANGLRVSPRVFMSTRSTKLIFASSFNPTSRFPPDEVSSGQPDPLLVAKRSETEQIEMVNSLQLSLRFY